MTLEQNNLRAGFSRVIISPENGVEIDGYFCVRRAEGVLDDLEIDTLALSMDGACVLIASMDLCHIKQEGMKILRETISDTVHIPVEQIFLAATHTHTGPVVSREFLQEAEGEAERNYFRKLKARVAEGARLALEDLKEARVGWAVGNAPGFGRSRRFRMKDGSVRTNPGLGNPDVVEPVGTMDNDVGVLRFDRKDGESIVIVNIGQHPDSVGGNQISADWPGFMRRTLERAIPGVKSMYLNGAEGDVGFINIWAKDGELNDLTMDFDDVLRGYGHTRHMGNVVAGAVLQVYDKVNYFEPDCLRFLHREIRIPANLPKPEEMEQARKYYALHTAGKDEEIPFKGMMLTTVVAEAERMIFLEHGPDSFSMDLMAIAIGKVVLLGIPGEPFAGIGLALKKSEEWDLVLPASNVNGAEGYFPMQEAYDEGGYEARSSYFKPGVAEQMIAQCRELLADL